MLAYNRANREVAVLCNHQRAAPKSHDAQVEKMEGALKDIEKELKAATKERKDLKKKVGDAHTCHHAHMATHHLIAAGLYTHTCGRGHALTHTHNAYMPRVRAHGIPYAQHLIPPGGGQPACVFIPQPLISAAPVPPLVRNASVSPLVRDADQGG